ncbi:MAG: hypothetical protein IID36_07395 [Planctomycetes bacterium]|nr:hypothetical protein [Planctomycetota bacterium]
MTARLATFALRTIGVAIFAAAIAWPMIALIGRVITDGRAPADGLTALTSHLPLHLYTLGLAVSATVLCMILALPAAIAVGQTGRIARRPWVAILLTAPLLCPPVVYAFGWERILPIGMSPWLRCVVVWALWAWPIPALLVGGAWVRTGRAAYEAAVLVTAPTKAFIFVVLPVLAPHVALSGLILLVIFLHEYCVPHACGMVVSATAILGWASDSRYVIDAIAPALPTLFAIVAGLALVGVIWRRSAQAENAAACAINKPAAARGVFAIAIGCFVVSFVVPIGGLLTKLSGFSKIIVGLERYGVDILSSLGVALFAAAMTIALGVGVVLCGRLATLALAATLVVGALPGAVVGVALIAGYNYGFLTAVYDHWPIVAISHVARYGWVGLIAVMLAARTTNSELTAQAETDGAGRLSVLAFVQFGLNWPTLLCGFGFVVVLSLAEVSASTLVRVPDFNPIAQVIFEKFHRFEDDMLVTLSLCLIAATIPAAGVLAWAFRHRDEG